MTTLHNTHGDHMDTRPDRIAKWAENNIASLVIYPYAYAKISEVLNKGPMSVEVSLRWYRLERTQQTEEKWKELVTELYKECANLLDDGWRLADPTRMENLPE